MSSLLNAPSSPAGNPAPPQQRLPWSSSSPPSPIELWHVARGAAAARTALEEEEEEEEEGKEELEGDGGAFFDPTHSCSASLFEEHDDDDDDDDARNRRILDKGRRSFDGGADDDGEPGEDGDDEGEEREEGERVRSSPNDRRHRRSSLSQRSLPLAAADPSDQLEDLIGSMLAMTAIGQRDDGIDNDGENEPPQRKEEKTKEKKGDKERLCACCGKPRRLWRRQAEAEAKEAREESSGVFVASAAAAHDASRYASVLSERPETNNPGWTHRVEEEEEENEREEEEGKQPRAKKKPKPRGGGGLPFRRRRRRPSGSASTLLHDSASPNLIVDRVARHEELSAIWASDPFLAAGGDTRAPRRRGRGLLAAAFAAEHALLGGGRARAGPGRRSSWP